MALQAEIIGCGRPWKSDVEVVAAADISQQNLDAFKEQHGLSETYLDYNEMLASRKWDIVSSASGRSCTPR
jgi:predicted dehydrogenase